LHEKNKEITKKPNFNPLDFLKIYTKILENYKYIDSDMMSFELFKDEKTEGGDLDETIKIKKESSPKEKKLLKPLKENKKDEKLFKIQSSNPNLNKTNNKKTLNK